MKKLFQYVFFGYRNPTQAETPKGGSHLTFEGGSANDKFNALVLLQNELKQRQIKST